MLQPPDCFITIERKHDFTKHLDRKHIHEQDDSHQDKNVSSENKENVANINGANKPHSGICNVDYCTWSSF